MSYDFEDGDRSPPVPRAFPPANGRDPAVIDQLLELAAISLTDVRGKTFTEAALLKEARAYAGPRLVLVSNDLRKGIARAKFLRSVRGYLALV